MPLTLGNFTPIVIQTRTFRILIMLYTTHDFQVAVVVMMQRKPLLGVGYGLGGLSQTFSRKYE